MGLGFPGELRSAAAAILPSSFCPAAAQAAAKASLKAVRRDGRDARCSIGEYASVMTGFPTIQKKIDEFQTEAPSAHP